jgi:hypothetical protein
MDSKGGEIAEEYQYLECFTVIDMENDCEVTTRSRLLFEREGQ